MDACGVVTDRCMDIGLERRTEGEVAADAETHDADFPWCDLRMLGKPVQASAAISIEMRNWSLRGVLLAADASGVIEWDRGSRWFDAAIDFRGSGNKSIPGQPNTGAYHGRCKLKNVGIAPDAGILTFGRGRGDEGSHRGTRQQNIRVFGINDHLLVCGRLWRGGGRGGSQSTPD